MVDVVVDYLDMGFDPRMVALDPNTFQRVVGDVSGSNNHRSLRLAVLGCEMKPPYGPNEHTADLLLDLLELAFQKRSVHECVVITLQLYNAQAQQYPTSSEWKTFDGVILPGSFSSAYDDSEPWIESLKTFIQTKIVPEQKPTLGICFGHQILAHSFAQGHAAPTPSGAHSGRYEMTLTPPGNKLFADCQKLDLYFSHGDMVHALPSTAVCLGGSIDVPIQAAAYFASDHDAQAYLQDDDSSSNQPFAVTFQAHPEYATSQDKGMYRTLELVMDAMVHNGRISQEFRLERGRDAHEQFERVQHDSVTAMVAACQALGWL